MLGNFIINSKIDNRNVKHKVIQYRVYGELKYIFHHITTSHRFLRKAQYSGTYSAELLHDFELFC